MKAMWAVLGVLVKHNGHLKSGVGGGKRVDEAPEAQLAAALTAGKAGSGYTLLARPPAEHVLHSAAVDVQQMLLSGRQADALRCAGAPIVNNVNLNWFIPEILAEEPILSSAPVLRRDHSFCSLLDQLFKFIYYLTDM